MSNDARIVVSTKVEACNDWFLRKFISVLFRARSKFSAM